MFVCMYVRVHTSACGCVHARACETPCTCSCLYNRPMREHPEMLESSVSSYNVTVVISLQMQFRSPIRALS